MNFIIIIASILNIVMFFVLLRYLYIIKFSGKFILKTKNGNYSINDFMLLTVGIIVLIYVSINMSMDIETLLVLIYAVQMYSFNIIIKKQSLGIREKGIMTNNNYIGSFYKWDKIKNYEWINSSTILFSVYNFFNVPKVIKLEVNNEQKDEINKSIKKYMD